jgi:hypothetical protein
MRFVHLLLLAALLVVPRVVPAKAWQGIVPGTSTRSDVLTRFGEPSTQGKLGGRTALVYRDDRAITGTRQAQFLVRDDGVVAEVNVFPATQLDRDSVEGTYGKGAHKTFTDDFRAVWIYRSLGVTVFFTKDNQVEAIRFQPPQAGASAPPSRAAAPEDGVRAPDARAGAAPER